eukprot:COSAG02_NODE_34286_length_486_cov_1.012920_1_plen_29_part_01
MVCHTTAGGGICIRLQYLGRHSGYVHPEL